MVLWSLSQTRRGGVFDERNEGTGSKIQLRSAVSMCGGNRLVAPIRTVTNCARRERKKPLSNFYGCQMGSLPPVSSANRKGKGRQDNGPLSQAEQTSKVFEESAITVGTGSSQAGQRSRSSSVTLPISRRERKKETASTPRDRTTKKKKYFYLSQKLKRMENVSLIEMANRSKL